MSRPSRLEAAKKAATAFVEAQPSSVDIGVVAFQTGALTTNQPSADHAQAVAAISRLQIAGGTSLAAAILTSLSAITGKPVAIGKDGTVAQHRVLGFGDDHAVLATAATTATPMPPPRRPPRPRTPGCTSRRSGSAPLRAPPSGRRLQDPDRAGRGHPRPRIAKTTGGSYHPASDAAELDGIASTINLRLTTHHESLPLAGAFTALVDRCCSPSARSSPSCATAGSSDAARHDLRLAVGPAGAGGDSDRPRHRLVVAASSPPGRGAGHARPSSSETRCPDGRSGAGASRPRCSCSAWPCSASERPVRRRPRRSRPARRRSCWLWTSRARCARPTSPRTGSPRPRRRRRTSSRRSRTAPAWVWSRSPASRPRSSRRRPQTDKLLTAMKTLTTSRGTAIGAGNPHLDRCDRRDRSVGAADRREGTGQQRVGVRRRDDRRAHRRREHAGGRPADRGPAGSRPQDSGLHDRLRNDDARRRWSVTARRSMAVASTAASAAGVAASATAVDATAG